MRRSPRLNEITAEFVEESRSVIDSDDDYDLADGHGKRTRRGIQPPEDAGPPATTSTGGSPPGVIADVAADLVGPDVVFHHSKLNFKWDAGADDVKWHQDIQFYPPHQLQPPDHRDVPRPTPAFEDGPLMVVPGSHNGPLYDQYDGAGAWIGCLSADDSAGVDADRVDYLTGPAGSITVHNCRTVPRLAAHRPAEREAAAPQRLRVRRRVPLHGPSSADPQHREGDPGQPGALGPTTTRAPASSPPTGRVGYDSIFAAQDDEASAQPATGMSM